MEPALDLSDLRAELDRIDDALHDLIMRRAAVVSQVAARKAQAGAPNNLRPGREAAILRRLRTRHHGDLAPATLVRLWRELFAGALAQQGPFAVAVTPGLEPVAREQFGALTPLHVCASAAEALAAVRRNAADIAVLPLPADGESNPWWPDLASAPRLFIVARLPFWAPRPHGACLTQAFAVAAAPPDPSGDDRSLILAPVSVCARLGLAGFDAGTVIAHGARALADVAGAIAESDPRLAAPCLTGLSVAGLNDAGAAPIVLGAYACPID
jgi:chorismate mutase